MKQVCLEKPGSFVMREADTPVRKAGEALVRVRRVGICGTDIHAYHGRQPFFEYPRVLGHELGVEVLELPEGEHGLRAGDCCSVEPYLNCGSCPPCRAGRLNCCESLRVLGVHVDGGMQPLLTIPVEKLHKGEGLSLDQLALVETLGIGAHGIERADVREGERVLIIGAGPIGLSAIPFARQRGADVVVMDMAAERLEFCRKELQVTRTVNPADGPVDEALRAHWDGLLPEVIVDATGNPKSMAGCFGLAPNGARIVFIGLFQGDLTFSDPDFHRKELTLLASRNSLPGTFREIIRLIQQGRVDTSSWITHRLGLDDLPARFEELTRSPGLVKGMISVDDA